MITACLILAGALAVVNAWSWFTQPTVPEFDAGRLPARVVEQRLKNDDARRMPGTGGSSTTGRWPNEASRSSNSPTAAEIEAQIAQRAVLARHLWIVAGIFAATAAAVAFWPRTAKPSETRRQARQGD